MAWRSDEDFDTPCHYRTANRAHYPHPSAPSEDRRRKNGDKNRRLTRAPAGPGETGRTWDGPETGEQGPAVTVRPLPRRGVPGRTRAWGTVMSLVSELHQTMSGCSHRLVFTAYRPAR